MTKVQVIGLILFVIFLLGVIGFSGPGTGPGEEAGSEGAYIMEVIR